MKITCWIIREFIWNHFFLLDNHIRSILFKKKVWKMFVVIKKVLFLQSQSRGSEGWKKRVEIFGKIKFIDMLEWCSKNSLNKSIDKSDKVGTDKQEQNYLGWRVWSWLRMNASGRLNTCKSRGSTSSNTWWRPAHGCVTRMQPTHKWVITLRNRR